MTNTRDQYFAPLLAQLDKDRPNWEIDWCNGRDLIDYVNESLRNPDCARSNLRDRLASRFHSVLHAAIASGVVIDNE